MERNANSGARYGVEIKGVTLHAEADDLAQVRTFLSGHAGRVHVFDRQSRSLLFEGSVNEVRKALGTLTALFQDNVRAMRDGT